MRRLVWPLLTPRSVQGRTSPFQAQGEVSPGKEHDPSPRDRRIYGNSPWSRELRGYVPARPARRRLTSASCSSARGFAPRFFHVGLAARRSAVRFRSL